jgi:hypothetical protein
MVCRVRFQNRVGLPCANAADDAAASTSVVKAIFRRADPVAMVEAAALLKPRNKA